VNKSRIRPFELTAAVMLKLNEKGGRGLGVDFYISGSVERKALLDAPKDLV
jgi:hypothetical protein